MPHPVASYLADLQAVCGSGTPETSGYPALANLLNFVGEALRPKIHTVIHPANSGAGLPDGGFFLAKELKKDPDRDAFLHIKPERGVLEVKSLAEDIGGLEQTPQAQRYLQHYGQILLSNYRSFALFTWEGGQAVAGEAFQLAESEAGFWEIAQHPKAHALLLERLLEYLHRALLRAAPLDKPQDLAFFLASYARDARARVEAAGDLPALTAMRGALEQALGMTFQAERGDHFFRSTLVQTLFYGVFSAWVFWHKENPGRRDRFDWRTAAWTLHVPMVKALFEQVATPTKLGALNLVSLLDWAAADLNRVQRPAFFQRFEEKHAVQYFYEPFLEAYDPALRKDLGVWYTPPEIVEYMVARVHTALREELDIPDGLADPRVFVLDPCCGTGAYVVEVLRVIHQSFKKDPSLAALAEVYTKQAAQERIFGFELLPAPFVVAHLQVGLMLGNLGVPLIADPEELPRKPDGSKADPERAAIYLTNALTGWEPPTGPKAQLTLAFPEFEIEKEAADEIKQQKRIIVILGNPPYNGYAGVAVDEERDLSTAYRTTKQAPAPQGQGLNDLYVRFFRMAERRIVEKSGEGMVCFISNYSWLDGLSFTGMRERYLEVFDRVTVDCLNGDKYKTGKLTPEGNPDPSVFSTEQNREGIQVGTAIATLVKRAARPARQATRVIHFRHWWGKAKRAELLASLAQPSKEPYETLQPPLAVGLPFLPSKTRPAFFQWPLLPALFPVSFPGVKTSRDEFLVDIDKDALLQRLKQYFAPQISHEEMRRLAPGVMKKTPRFQAEAVRDKLRQRGLLGERIVPYCYRPFDVRWLYWEPETELLDRKRTDYFRQVFEGNVWLVAQQKPRREWSDPQFILSIGCLDLMDRGASCIPLWLKPNHDHSSLFERHDSRKPEANVSEAAKDYLASLRLGKKPEELFYHTLAVLHAPAYRTENAGALRQDWPRVPLPKSRPALLASAALGRQVAALLDTENPVAGVTAGKTQQKLRSIAVLARLTQNPLNLSLTAGWGHAGKGGVTMPGKGKLETRAFTDSEAAALGEQAVLLGPDTRDIFLNAETCWRNVPARVWDYTIGGYQVLKKWLSYREHALLKRPLSPDEARYFTNAAQRIAALIAMQPELDANYQACAASHSAESSGE